VSLTHSLTQQASVGDCWRCAQCARGGATQKRNKRAALVPEGASTEPSEQHATPSNMSTCCRKVSRQARVKSCSQPAELAAVSQPAAESLVCAPGQATKASSLPIRRRSIRDATHVSHVSQVWPVNHLCGGMLGSNHHVPALAIRQQKNTGGQGARKHTLQPRGSLSLASAQQHGARGAAPRRPGRTVHAQTTHAHAACMRTHPWLARSLTLSASLLSLTT
jgi:hypothetical protein